MRLFSGRGRVALLHVLHYLWQAAIAIHGGTTEAAQAWVMTYLEKLLTRPAVDVVSGLRQSATLRGVTEGKARKAVDTCAEYLRRRARQVDYAEALRCGLPIATCVIEGACRSLVQDRMGITGARWSVEGAEAVLRIRALRASGDWEAYCRFHVRKEHQRNYPRAEGRCVTSEATPPKEPHPPSNTDHPEFLRMA